MTGLNETVYVVHPGLAEELRSDYVQADIETQNGKTGTARIARDTTTYTVELVCMIDGELEWQLTGKVK